MRVYIFADMEGISGVSGSDFVTGDGRFYQLGRKYYTQDMNACARACFSAGADEVIIRDGHSSGNHALLEELDPRVELIQGGTGSCRLPGVDGCDALILLGYHALAGTPRALLEHTYSSKHVQNLWLNDRLVGEVGIDAAIAAEHGVPTVMVSGDDHVCREAADWIPGVTTCQVKQGLSCQGARLLSLKKAHDLIAQKTATALANLPVAPKPQIEYPVRLRLEVIERGGVRRGPEIVEVDGRTCQTTAATVEEAFFRLF